MNDVNDVEALKLATCAQVEYWLHSSEDMSINSSLTSVSIGSFSYSVGADNSPLISNRSLSYLRSQRLLARGVMLNGNSSPAVDSDLHN